MTSIDYLKSSTYKSIKFPSKEFHTLTIDMPLTCVQTCWKFIHFNTFLFNSQVADISIEHRYTYYNMLSIYQYPIIDLAFTIAVIIGAEQKYLN